MKNVFCTISTQSHLFKCFALADSLTIYEGILHILLVDASKSEISAHTNVVFHRLDDIEHPVGRKIIQKYKDKLDCLRWSLKSIFLLQLLESEKKAIYVDNDILFYDDPQFLIDDLEEHPVILTPHHYPRNPEKNQNWLEANFKVGLYNAGFIGVNQQGKAVLTWWAKACLYRCEKNSWRGLFDDQKYLDLLPIIEPQTKVLNHLGCNVAEWNAAICKKKESKTGVVINDEFPLVFYHFSGYSLQELDQSSYLFTSYLTALQKYKPGLSAIDLIPKASWLNKIKLQVWRILNNLNE